jgi:hypothetical protein
MNEEYESLEAAVAIELGAHTSSITNTEGDRTRYFRDGVCIGRVIHHAHSDSIQVPTGSVNGEPSDFMTIVILGRRDEVQV